MITPDDREAATRAALDACLATAETWLRWSGQARVGIGSVWTPHKVLRGITDHFIDHLFQVEALVAGVPACDVTWQGRIWRTNVTAPRDPTTLASETWQPRYNRLSARAGRTRSTPTR